MHFVLRFSSSKRCCLCACWSQVVATPDDGSELSTAFNVHPSTGAITLIKPVMDFEYQRMYSLTIVAIDHVSVSCDDLCHVGAQHAPGPDGHHPKSVRNIVVVHCSTCLNSQ